MTTKIAWVSGKLYKTGKISTQAELSRKANWFHRKNAPSHPLCVCVHFSHLWLALTLPICTFQVIKKKKKQEKKQIIFWYISVLLLCIRQQSINSQIRPHCTFICAAFFSHMKWSNAQHVSTPTTIILPITAGTYHCLNCLSHMIYCHRLACTKILQHFLTHPSSFDTSTIYTIYVLGLLWRISSSGENGVPMA